MRIRNNIQAMNTHRQYSINNSSVAKSAEKLSSGYKINRAGDDAAGLAISEKMRAQIRGLSRASLNSQDAISLVQTAEGALQETHNILQRMRELSVQSASDTNEKTVDRNALQAEFEQLQTEIDDIASKTRFNDQNLIDGTFQKTKMYVDGGSSAGGFNAVVDRAVAGSYTLTVTGVTGAAQSAVPGTANSVLAGQASNMGIANTAANAMSTVGAATGSANNITTSGHAWTGAQTAEHNGMTYTLDFSGSKASAMTVHLKDSAGNVVSTLQNVDFKKAAGASANVVLSFEGVGTLTYTLDTTTAVSDDVSGANAVKAAFNAKKIAFNGLGEAPGVVPAKEGYVEFDLSGYKAIAHLNDTKVVFKELGIEFQFDAIRDATIAAPTSVAPAGGPVFTNGSFNVMSNEGATLVIQSGANQGDTIDINIDAMNTAMLGIAGSKIDTQANAANAITEVNDAINIVSTQRALLGALQNRLDHKIANLDNTAENLQSAESRIRDVDIAKEMSNYTKSNILSQAATAMLAQANSAPQNVLSLLQ